MERFQEKVTIVNKYGLHARPAMKFVETANQFRSRIWVHHNGNRVDGKSVMELMILAATCGTDLEIVAEGEDAQQAVQTLTELVKNKFGCDNE